MCDSEKTALPRWTWYGVIAIPAILVAVAIVICIFLSAPSGAGEFGDMFGGVNALFSGFAFLGVIIAIWLQRDELTLQRLELSQTRKELAGQKEQLKLQNATFRQQSFDTTFFQMLALHNQIVGAIDRVWVGLPHTGRDCFVGFYDMFDSEFRNTNNDARFLSQIQEGYMSLYEDIQPDVGHYFRNLYHIVKFVDQSSVDDKRFYTNLVRAQLSSHELLLLFYNCLTALGEEKFKPLVERYELLKHMPKEKLIRPEHTDFWPMTRHTAR